ncbi:Hsp70 family protein [Enemella evansiae]|uniref:Hsp70 family protein n=1 Tax=Enemella evansiae TaxID=2016499 RepID=UPI0010605967|nr:Hsp70 family protein [Enemella evansiae]TDO92995.1 chaperone protein HscA [Enemella evansiae]
MHLGVDFGTTRTIVAYVDRGNYPVVSFTDQWGDPQDHFPSVVAIQDGRLMHGFDALAAAEQGAPVLRSFKRALAAVEVGPQTTIELDGAPIPLLELLVSHLKALREAITEASSVSAEPLESCAIAVPAHAHSAQRFLTLEAFRRAGFTVHGMLNEPSAAGFEYTHRQARTVTSRRRRVIVYDLGGGTFDASLVRVDGTAHEVLDSLGLNNLGGDDFDRILVDQALATAGADVAALTARELDTLLADCREAKERLSPQSRRIALDVPDGSGGTAEVTLKVADFYAAAAPLVQTSIEAMAPLVGGLDGADELADVAGIYLVGGGSGLPMVPRLLRERFGRRVHRSPYPAASTAIGLAISVDEQSGFSLTDRLSRGFGVFREGSAGQRLQFDPILDRAAALPEGSELIVTRRYRAAHNLGVFRFVEYAALDEAGEPRGDLVPFGQVAFPFDPDLQRAETLDPGAVWRREPGPEVEERYVIDRNGIVTVHITDLDTGYRRTEALSAG